MSISDAPVTTCYRHAGRESYVRCTRCDRYICPDCMREASVGHQCPDCVKSGNKNVRQARTIFGGRAVTAQGAPYATIGLIIANFVVYAVELMRKSAFDDLALLPAAMRGPEGGLYKEMASPPPGFHDIGVAHGEWYRLLSSMFTHSLPTQAPFGPTHIIFNMLALWTLGTAVEQHLGRTRFLATYLLSGLGSSVLVYLLAAPYSESMGASGAVFGLVGVYFLLSRKLHFDPIGAHRQLIIYVIWLVAASKVTSWQGHFGGLVTGLVVGAVMVYAPRAKQAAVQAAGLAVIFALLVGATAARTSALAANPGDPAEGLAKITAGEKWGAPLRGL